MSRVVPVETSLKRTGGSKKKPVTIRDIARHVGLNHRTVSQALNGNKESTSKVSDKTRLRVQEVAKELGYRPNRAARALRTGSGGLIGIINFHGVQHLNTVRLAGALEEAHRVDLPPLVYQAGGTKSAMLEACHALSGASVDGVLLLGPPPSFDEECLEALQWSTRPVVAFGGVHLAGISRYVTDREEGFRAITQHLVDEGYRSLCFLAFAPEHGMSPEESVLSIFHDTIAQARRKGKKVKGWVHYMDPRASPSRSDSPIPGLHALHVNGYLGMREIIASGNLPEALLCRADVLAQGALLACREAGISVPEQMGITGFDDEPASSANWTPITSVGYSSEEAIRPAVAELYRLVRGESKPQARLTLIPGKLVVRQSSSRHPLPIPALPY